MTKQKPAEMGTSGLVTYTRCLHAKDGSSYFGVAMPVYLLKGVIPDQTLGSVFLVFNVECLSNILSSSLLNDIEYIRQINNITYLILLAALGTICVIVYRKAIKPIRRQIEFMIGYTSNTDNRIDILEYNELGEPAQKMNEILNGVETLNSKIIEDRRKYLELEYAKKQTAHPPHS